MLFIDLVGTGALRPSPNPGQCLLPRNGMRMQMGYVVVVCSRCKLAKGAPEKQKTTMCPSCGRTLHIADLKKYYHAESLPEVRDAIGRLNAKLRGGLDAYTEEAAEKLKRGVKKGNSVPLAPSPDTSGDMLLTGDRSPSSSRYDRRILDFLDMNGVSTPEQILRGLAKSGMTRELLEKRLNKLCEGGYIYEPSVGKYKIV
jgi:hypothetical protein